MVLLLLRALAAKADSSVIKESFLSGVISLELERYASGEIVKETAAVQTINEEIAEETHASVIDEDAAELSPQIIAPEPTASIIADASEDIPEESANNAENEDKKNESGTIEYTKDDISGIKLNNTSGYDVDVKALINEPLPEITQDEPSILIIHTHASEAFTPTAENNYVASDTYRTEDIAYSVVKLGDEITDILSDKGISVIHDRGIYDYPSYNGSYKKTLTKIEEYLKKYPSIKMVIDVHRDSLVSDSGDTVKTTAVINGEQCAQAMLVVGTDAGGLEHPEWKKNLSFALKIQATMNREYPGLARNLNLRAERFNQHTTTGSLIAELGCSGNTLEEALATAKYFANTLAEVLGY